MVGSRNLLSPRELSPHIQLLPRSGNVNMMGFLTDTFQYVRLPDLKVDLLFLRPHFVTLQIKHMVTRIFWKLKAYKYALPVVNPF